MDPVSPADIFLFDKFRFDRRGRGLFYVDGRAPIVVGSRALDVLGVLIERAGDLVPKHEIMEAVWPDTTVEEANLTVQISTLRRVLDNGRSETSCIQTIPGRGYRFVGVVIGHDPGSDHSFGLLPDKPSIAVLPFANMSNDAEQEFFAVGIAEDVITALSCYPSLFVIARSSCLTYKGRAVGVKQVARELGVRYVLEGSLRKSGSRIRVTAQLVEAETGAHVWAERYDRDLTDIFAVQDEITEAVTIAIAPAIAGAEQQRAMRKPAASLDAWAAYQRGLWHLGRLTKDDNSLAEKFFQRAVELDPTFAGGHWGLASAQFEAASIFRTRNLSEAQVSAENSARHAVDLDGTDAEARSSLGYMLLMRGDYEGALSEARRALAIAPNLAAAHGTLGGALTFSGRPKNARKSLEMCIRLDPLGPSSAIRLHNIAQSHYFSCEYGAAVEALQRNIRANPNHPLAYRWLAASLGQLGRVKEAKESLERTIAIAPCRSTCTFANARLGCGRKITRI